jgi:hypothetical protein
VPSQKASTICQEWQRLFHEISCLSHGLQLNSYPKVALIRVLVPRVAVIWTNGKSLWTLCMFHMWRVFQRSWNVLEFSHENQAKKRSTTDSTMRLYHPLWMWRNRQTSRSADPWAVSDWFQVNASLTTEDDQTLSLIAFTEYRINTLTDRSRWLRLRLLRFHVGQRSPVRKYFVVLPSIRKRWLRF